MVRYLGVPFAGYSFCVLFFLHFDSKTQDTQSVGTQPVLNTVVDLTNCQTEGISEAGRVNAYVISVQSKYYMLTYICL